MEFVLLQVGVELHMSMLLVRDNYSGICINFDQGSHSGYEVVHRSDSLLILDSI